MTDHFNPTLDLRLERLVDVHASKIWQCWTSPELLMPWFCPKPWRVTDCRIDLRPGGEFFTHFKGPEGEEFENPGCYLEIVPNQKLVWTSALGPGFRPKPVPERSQGSPNFHFTAQLSLELRDGSTLYQATAIHACSEDRQAHAKMGFQEGWGVCLDQLLDFIKSSNGP